MKRKYILSIDGGGIKGIIPLSLLVKLEETTGKLSREIFSFVSGTSTGAIIAGGIAAGIPAQKMLDLYLTRAHEILSVFPWKVVRRIVSGHMYSIEKLHALLSEELHDAKDWTLNDSPVDILVTAKRLSDGLPFYFVKDNPKNTCQCGDIRLVDAMTASAAAPTYFSPWDISQFGAFVDGSIGVAGNPVYQTCVEAFCYTKGYDPKHTTVVSLGTGRFTFNQTPQWLGAWLAWVLHELLESPGEQQTEITHRQFPQSRLYRIDPDLRLLDETLTTPIALDAIDEVKRLATYGKELSLKVDWSAILDGTDRTFLVTQHKTEWKEYKKMGIPKIDI